MDINIEAAESLIERAFNTTKASEADLLIKAAAKLNPAVDVLKTVESWTNKVHFPGLVAERKIEEV